MDHRSEKRVGRLMKKNVCAFAANCRNKKNPVIIKKKRKQHRHRKNKTKMTTEKQQKRRTQPTASPKIIKPKLYYIVTLIQAFFRPSHNKI